MYKGMCGRRFTQPNWNGTMCRFTIGVSQSKTKHARILLSTGVREISLILVPIDLGLVIFRNGRTSADFHLLKIEDTGLLKVSAQYVKSQFGILSGSVAF